jgi:hypothetical protein
MDIMLFILYYETLFFILSLYIFLRKKGFFSISDAIVLVTTVVITLGGYYISYGYTYGINQFNYKLFLDYIIFLVVVPIGLLIGNRILIKENIMSLLNIKVNSGKLKLLLVLILGYATLYFYFIKDNIPLILLLTNGVANFGDLAMARLAITHDYSGNYDIPFILRYYRLIINDLMRFILAIIFLMYLQNRKKYKKAFIFSLITTIFFHTYHLEKSGLIYILLSLFVCYVLYKDIRVKENISLYLRTGLISIVLLVGMYMVFMGVDSVESAFKNMLNRALIDQTGMVYYQDNILETQYNGILWGDGVPMFLIDSLLNRNIVNLSSDAYSVVFPQYAKQGGTGTTGGMPMFYLRSNFGYILGTMMLLVISIITGVIDNILRKGIASFENKILVIALYSVMLIYFIQAFIGNFTRVYMLPFIFSPQVIIILLAIIFLTFGKKNKS